MKPVLFRGHLNHERVGMGPNCSGTSKEPFPQTGRILQRGSLLQNTGGLNLAALRCLISLSGDDRYNFSTRFILHLPYAFELNLWESQLTNSTAIALPSSTAIKNVCFLSSYICSETGVNTFTLFSGYAVIAGKWRHGRLYSRRWIRGRV